MLVATSELRANRPEEKMREKPPVRVWTMIPLALMALGCGDSSDVDATFGVSICDTPLAEPARFEFTYSISALDVVDVEVDRVVIPSMSGEANNVVLQTPFEGTSETLAYDDFDHFGLRFRIEGEDLTTGENGSYWCRASLGERPLAWFVHNWVDPGDRQFDTPISASQVVPVEAVDQFECPVGSISVEVSAQAIDTSAPDQANAYCLAGGLDAYTYQPRFGNVLSNWDEYEIVLMPNYVQDDVRPDGETVVVARRSTSDEANDIDLAALPTTYYLRLRLFGGDRPGECDISRAVHPDRDTLPLLENAAYLNAVESDILPCPIENYPKFDWRAIPKPLRPNPSLFNN